MARLQDRVAIVTGAAQGIGAAYAEALAEAGAKVVIADILDGSATAARIANRGTAIAIETDVASPVSVKAMVDAVLDRFGRIDILVNNAALFGGLAQRPFWEIDNAEWDKVMQVNTRGPFECAKAVLPAMRARNYGKIINIASGTVFKGTPLLLHYVGSKGAIIAMTRAMARELGAFNICVNALAPGLTMSDAVINNPTFTPAMTEGTKNSRAFKREQKPEDLTGALIFLASAESDFMTGQTMLVDGGSAMH